MSKSGQKSKAGDKKSRSKPERDLYESVGGPLVNAVWIFIFLALICFAIGHPGWGWCFLILSIVPVVLFLVFHVVITDFFTKIMKDIPHR